MKKWIEENKEGFAYYQVINVRELEHYLSDKVVLPLDLVKSALSPNIVAIGDALRIGICEDEIDIVEHSVVLKSKNAKTSLEFIYAYDDLKKMIEEGNDN